MIKWDQFLKDKISEHFDDFLNFITSISCKIKFGSRQEGAILGLPHEILK